jgi:hypothetical protein
MVPQRWFQRHLFEWSFVYASNFLLKPNLTTEFGYDYNDNVRAVHDDID